MNTWMIRKNLMKDHYQRKKKVCHDFEIKNLGEYKELYVQSDALLLAAVFNKFQNMS